MRNHYVPREYLRGFSPPSSPRGIWQFDKKTRSFAAKPAAIARVAYQNDFYSDETERLLERLVERPGNRILRKLRLGDLELSKEDRADLSAYIATMMCRVPRYRDKGKELAAESLPRVASDLRNKIRDFEESGLLTGPDAERLIEETDAVEMKLSCQTPENVQEQICSPWPRPHWVSLVYSMHWRYVKATSGQYFVTTDNPVFHFRCYGFARERAELTFPVSTDLAIFGSWQPIRGNNVVERRTQFVKEANRRLISDATRFVYFRSKAQWITKVADKDSPYLSRIGW